MESQFNFLSTPKELVLLNSTNADVKIFQDGEMRIIPSSTRVTMPHPKYSDVCHSLQLADGTWIPGTIVLRDLYEVDETGQEKLVWSAANAVKATLQIDVKTGKAAGKYSDKGVSLIPPGATLAQIKSIAIDGRRRWQKFQLEQAYATVASWDQQNAARSKAGMAVINGGPEYAAAAATIAAFSKEVQDEVYARFKADNEALADMPVAPVWEMEERAVPEVVPNAKVVQLIEAEDEAELKAELLVPKPQKDLAAAFHGGKRKKSEARP